jgi:single-strand DNA-binding protein
MSSMNNVSLIGRLTQDPDLRYTQSGKAVSSFGIAINEKYKSGDEWKTDVCFVEVTAWDKTAEATAQYLKKGHLCGIVGKLKYEQWESDGNKRSKLVVTAKNVIFLEKKEDGAD